MKQKIPLQTNEDEQIKKGRRWSGPYEKLPETKGGNGWPALDGK